jgi:hypothetical protein
MKVSTGTILVHATLLLLAISKVNSFLVELSDIKLYNSRTSTASTSTSSTSREPFRIPKSLALHRHGHGQSLDFSLGMMTWESLESIFERVSKTALSTGAARPIMGTNKRLFYQSLKQPYAMNEASNECTTLLNRMIEEKTLCSDINRNPVTTRKKDIIGAEQEEVIATLSLDNPGLNTTFSRVAPGTWNVVYAPHIANGAKVFGGKFDVQYNLYTNGSITSHARYEFPILGSGYLSVSGRYGSKDNLVCRVEFDRAWVRPFVGGNASLYKPYECLEEVPDSIWKWIINNLGKIMFIEEFAVFPISFLDEDTIVFDFELLGTRICARKIMR